MLYDRQKWGSTDYETSAMINIILLYVFTNEYQVSFRAKTFISSHVNILPLLWLHDKSRLSHQKTIKVKWFGISLVFI